jgi:hypothetical protein
MEKVEYEGRRAGEDGDRKLYEGDGVRSMEGREDIPPGKILMVSIH